MEYRCKRHGNLVSTSRPFVPDSDDCYECWPRETRRSGPPKPPPPPQRGPCLHLGTRVEFRPGCNGRMCLHLCLAGEPEAVPGGNCQTCPKWEADA